VGGSVPHDYAWTAAACGSRAGAQGECEGAWRSIEVEVREEMRRGNGPGDASGPLTTLSGDRLEAALPSWTITV
jgi:hypothetical protein